MPMTVLIFFIVLWYVSLFFQTFLNHRYAAHSQFTMSPFWEKVFFVGNWLANGSSYLSPRAYGILHRMHHAFADTEKDPHSPSYSKNLFSMMWDTRTVYSDVYYNRIPLEERFTKGVPEWNAFDRFAESMITRVLFGAAYTAFFVVFATAWWQFLLLPLVYVIGPLHGAIINWFAHKIGYRNFETKDTSRNILPVDILMMGEGYHNNHHKHASRANFGHRWFEIDPVYLIMRVFHFLGIIQLKERTQKAKSTKIAFRFSGEELNRIIADFKAKEWDTSKLTALPEQKLKESLAAWEKFVEKDWKGDVQAYLNNLQVREELQVFWEQANASMKEKIETAMEKADTVFQEKMKPLDPQMAKKFNEMVANHGHFWQNNSIVAG